MTPEGFLFACIGFVLLICIIVVIAVASTITTTVAAVVDDEDEEEQYKISQKIEKGNEKEEYITRLPREKHPLAERCFEVRLMEGSF